MSPLAFALPGPGLLFGPLAADASTIVKDIRYPGAPPGWALVLLVAALALLVRWIYRRERQKVSRPWRVLLGGLRIIAILLVALALFRPEREVSRVALDKSHLVVLLDTSSSMATKDRYRSADEGKLLAAVSPDGSGHGTLDLTRLEITQRVLAGEGEPLLRSLADRFVLHIYAFDDALRLLASTEARGTETLHEPAAGESAGPVYGADAAGIARAIRGATALGTQTAIGAALKDVARDFVGRDDRRLAGVVLITDGHDNAFELPLDAIASLGKGAEELRVQALALGEPTLTKNLWMDKVLAKPEVLALDPVRFPVEIRQKGFDPGFDGVRVELKITRIAGPDFKRLPKPEPVDPNALQADHRELGKLNRLTTTARLLPSTKATSVTDLVAVFEKAGEYDVAITATLPSPHAAEEAVVEDNTKHHHLLVRDQTIKVLLVDREMRYETHFLKNILTRESRHSGDPRRVDTHVWIQSFDPDVRQPSGGGFKLTPLRAFPSTRQEIFAYDVIIVGDVNWRQFALTDSKSTEILSILRDFVAEGGGMALVAGEAFNPVGFIDTPLEDLVPVVVSAGDRTSELGKTVPFRVAPTEEGREHPILSVLQDRPEKVDEIWREHDGWEWYWLYRSKGDVKPGAVALARVWNARGPEFQNDRGLPCVVFAKAEFGRGRVFFSAIDQISRIRMSYADVYYGAFWDETIRWLSTYRGGNKRFRIETDKKSYFVGETATIKVAALDSDYQPMKTEVLRGLEVEGPDGKPMLSEADVARHSNDDDWGLYKTGVRLPQTGTYRIYVDPPDRSAESRAEYSIEARFATREDQDKGPDHELLRAIVEKTNPTGGQAQPGRVYAPWQARDLVNSIPSRTTEREIDPHVEPLWDNGWILLLVTAVLAVEWILRKKFQMI